MEEFKKLIDVAHQNGIKIMVDIVINHSGYGTEALFGDMLRSESGDDIFTTPSSGLPDFRTEDPVVRAKLIKWQVDWLEKAKTESGNTIDYFRVDTVKHVEDATWKELKSELTKANPEFKMIGGGMAYTFLKAQGYSIGTSLCEDDRLDYAKEMIEKAKAKGVNFLLPVDNRIAAEFKDVEAKVTEGQDIPDGFMGLDIGPKTEKIYADAIKDAKTVVWNGPMGVFEFENYNKGTIAVAKAMADADATTVIGGGDSAAAVNILGFGDKMTHISTGGGASLEFLEGKTLPGIAALNDK